MIIRTRYERSDSLLAQQIKHDLAVALQDEFNTHKLYKHVAQTIRTLLDAQLDEKQYVECHFNDYMVKAGVLERYENKELSIIVLVFRENINGEILIQLNIAGNWLILYNQLSNAMIDIIDWRKIE